MLVYTTEKANMMLEVRTVSCATPNNMWHCVPLTMRIIVSQRCLSPRDAVPMKRYVTPLILISACLDPVKYV